MRKFMENVIAGLQDCRKEIYMLLRHPERLETDAQRAILNRFRKNIISDGEAISNKIYQKIYECIFAGDPKSRTQRAIMESMMHELRMTEQLNKKKSED